MNENYLTPFLYLLIRDEVTSGVIERIMKDIEKIQDTGGNPIYSNKFLADYAKSIADRLLDS